MRTSSRAWVFAPGWRSPWTWLAVVVILLVLVNLAVTPVAQWRGGPGVVVPVVLGLLAGAVVLLGPVRVLPAAAVLVIVASGLLSALVPTSYAFVLVYFTAGVTVHRLSRIAAAVVLVIATAVISVLVLVVFGGDLRSLGTQLLLVALVALVGELRKADAARQEQVELALARAQAVRQEHARSAALAERTRIARDVHDVLAHSLSALALNLQTARLMLVNEGASEQAVDQVQRAQRLAAEGLADARRAVATLRSDQNTADLRPLIQTYRTDSGAPAELSVLGTPRTLPEPVTAALYRTAQEALTNTRRHAPGAPVRLVLDYRAGQVELTVSDHPGHRPAPAEPGGYGLVGMRERAELLGGTLACGPTEDGWQVRVVIPG